MRIRTRKSGIGIYLGVSGLIGVLVLLVGPSIVTSKDMPLKRAARSYLNKSLDLSGNMPIASFSVLSRLGPAVLAGSYPAKLESIRLDIKFRHFEKLRDDRNKAIEIGVLLNPKTVPAILRVGGRRLKISMRLKGDLNDHRYGPERWSFRIRIKNGEAINGFTEFSLQRPTVRQIPYDQLYQLWVRKMGGLTPRTEFYRVYVNGDYWGIMLAEEHMSKSLVELNERREAPLIKFGTEDIWYYRAANRHMDGLPTVYYGTVEARLYNERYYRNDDRMRSLFSYAVQTYRKVKRGEIQPQDFLDSDAFSKTLLTALVWNDSHPLKLFNSRFYLNPYTLKLEPVTTDQLAYFAIDKAATLQAMSFGGKTAAWDFDFYHGIIASENFFPKFEGYIQDLRRTLPYLAKEWSRVCRPFPFDCPAHQPVILESNLHWVQNEGRALLHEWVKQVPFEPKKEVSAIESPRNGNTQGPVIYPKHIFAEYNEHGELIVYNLLGDDLILTDIRTICVGSRLKVKDDCESANLLVNPIVLPSGFDGIFPAKRVIELAIGHIDGAKRLRISSSIGSSEQVFEIAFTHKADQFNPLLGDGTPIDQIKSCQCIGFDGDTANIFSGDWVIDKPIIFPKGMSLTIDPGAVLSFSKNAYIVLRGPLIANGTEVDRIILQASDKTWKGIYVLEATSRSSIRWVTITNTDFTEDGVLQLTGGTNFYRSDVDVSNVVFDGTRAEDALNIVHSEFTMTDTSFLNTASDGFDVDFSQGYLRNIVFQDIGGDALDTSGSRISGGNIDVHNVRDKAISAGEVSHVVLLHVSANHVGAAVVAKDGSDMTIRGLSVSGQLLSAGMSYQKKSIYGPARLVIEDTSIPASMFHNQSGNSLSVNGNIVPGIKLNIDRMYHEGPMMKTKRVGAAEN